MPVLTTPFAAIAEQAITAVTVQFPKSLELPTELTITPVAGETWKVEGISLAFSDTYVGSYSLNTKQAFESLEAVKTHLNEQATFAAERIKKLENVFTKVSTKEGLGAIATEEAAANTEAARAELKAINAEQSKVFQELAELGRTQTIEGAQRAPLRITARLYARGNELVWTSILDPEQYFTPTAFTRHGNYSNYAGTWIETYALHEQFDDPIEITERENLKFALEFRAPPAVTEKEGGLEGPNLGLIGLTEVSAIVNYSH
jgi:hypothetical protein